VQRPPTEGLRLFRIVLTVGIAGATLLRLARTFPSHAELRNDFGAFVAAGRALRASENPYILDPRLVPSLAGYAPMLSAPPILPFADLVGTVDPLLGLRAVILLSAVAYAVLGMILLRRLPAKRRLLGAAWLVSLDCLWATLTEGQIYCFLALAVIGAWTLLDRHPIAAGVLMGIAVAVKPNLLLWPAMLALAGAWAPALACVASAMPLALISAFAYGPGVYRDWIMYALAGSRDSYAAPMNGSLPTVFIHVGLPALAVPMSVLLVGLLMLLVWRQQPGTRAVSNIAIIAAVFVSPIAWTGYLLLALPTFFGKRINIPLLLAGALMVFPISFLPEVTPLTTARALASVIAPMLFALLTVGAIAPVVVPPGGQNEVVGVRGRMAGDLHGRFGALGRLHQSRKFRPGEISDGR